MVETQCLMDGGETRNDEDPMPDIGGAAMHMDGGAMHMDGGDAMHCVSILIYLDILNLICQIYINKIR